MKNWNDVRLPGRHKPSANPPYIFDIQAGQSIIRRAAFDGVPVISRASRMNFTFFSPTSNVMFPDIIRGDFGYPTICLKNTEGTVYRFARGNMKDFFDITRPNELQSVSIPVSAFVFDKDLKGNVKSSNDFFDFDVVSVYFDFLPHPLEMIDIHLGEIDFNDEEEHDGIFDVLDLVDLERVNQALHLPTFSTETNTISFGLSLSRAAQAAGIRSAELRLAIETGGGASHEHVTKLAAETTNIGLKVENVGSFEILGTLTSEGREWAHSVIPGCRVLPKRDGIPTILGISDAGDFDKIAALGGSWDRLPIDCLPIIRSNTGDIRFSSGNNSMPRTTPGRDRFRIMAPFRMPKWLSAAADRPDYHRYRPADWLQYSELVKFLSDEMCRSGVTHYEVWNEASAIGHWNDDMESLVELHRVTYEAVKERAPSLTVLGGCTHSWTFDFLRRFLEKGGGNYCDGLALHGYTYQPNEYVKHYDGVEELLREYGEGRKDYKGYITEIGFRYPAFSLEAQAKYLLLYTLEAASRSTIGAVLWFRYTNPRPENVSVYRQNSSTGYALVGHDDSYCRPAVATYRLAERLLQQFEEIRASGPGTDRRYEFVMGGEVEALGIFKPHGTPEFPRGWVVLNQYGGASVGSTDLQFAISPRSLHLLH